MKLVIGLVGLFALACAASGEKDGEGSSSEAGSSTAAGSSSGSESAPPTESSSESSESSGGEPSEPRIPTMLPTPTGTCPELVEGDVTFTPAGIEPRAVKL